jgi:hypothetical protein
MRLSQPYITHITLDQNAWAINRRGSEGSFLLGAIGQRGELASYNVVSVFHTSSLKRGKAKRISIGAAQPHAINVYTNTNTNTNTNK